LNRGGPADSSRNIIQLILLALSCVLFHGFVPYSQLIVPFLFPRHFSISNLLPVGSAAENESPAACCFVRKKVEERSFARRVAPGEG